MPNGASNRIRTELKHISPIAEAAGRKLAFVFLDERHQIRSNVSEGARPHSCRAQFGDDAGDGAWKSRRVCNNLILFEPAVGPQLMDEPGDDRLRPEPTERDEPASR